MRWEDTPTGALAYAGDHLIGSIVAMWVPDYHRLHGKVAWTLYDARGSRWQHPASGHVATKARAKMAVVKAWRRWLDERGLVEQEAALGMVREALAKASL